MDLSSDFAFTPTGGPNRIIRYEETVPAIHLFASDGGLIAVVATLDLEKNILVVKRDYFDRLSDVDRHRVLRTRERLTYVAPYRDIATGGLYLLAPKEAALRLEAREYAV